MARVFQNMISAPTGLNRRIDETKIAGAGVAAQGIGQGLNTIAQGISNAYKDYEQGVELERKRAAEDAEKYEAQRIRQERLNRVAAALSQNPELKQDQEWLAASENYVNGDDDALLKLYREREQFGLQREQLEQTKEANRIAKEAQELEKMKEEYSDKTHDELYEQLQSLDVDLMTDKNIVGLKSGERQAIMTKLKALKSVAVRNHFDDLVTDINKTFERLQAGGETASSKAAAAARKKELNSILGGS